MADVAPQDTFEVVDEGAGRQGALMPLSTNTATGVCLTAEMLWGFRYRTYPSYYRKQKSVQARRHRLGFTKRYDMLTPDKDWRLWACVGAGVGGAVFFVPRLFGVAYFGILGTAFLAVIGLFAGLVAYSVLFLRHPQ